MKTLEDATIRTVETERRWEATRQRSKRWQRVGGKKYKAARPLAVRRLQTCIARRKTPLSPLTPFRRPTSTCPLIQYEAFWLMV